jgi:hypothetical protein
MALVALILGGTQGVFATHEPADKVSAAGSTGVVAAPGQSVTLLQDQIKTAKPTDLILSVTAECTITTELTTVGNDNQFSSGLVRVWVEIDGKPVPVSQDDNVAGDVGKVNFCDRLEERETTLFDDEDATIRTLQRVGQSAGFNWMALDVGAAVHTITVKADLTTTASQDASALAAVGKRTLIIEPTKAANDEAITTLG